MRAINTLNATPSTATSSSPPLSAQQRSPWHSPVPYLFGGLAAMLGLIAFALLILACSYWRLSGRLDDGEGDGDGRDLENGNEKDGNSEKTERVFEEKFLVIMAGNEKPTFLATPVSSRGSSFGDKSSQIENKDGDKKVENGDKLKEEMCSHDQIRSGTEEVVENRETQESQSQETEVQQHQ